MKTIIAGKQFMQDVLAGRKRQTVRLWAVKRNLLPGEIVALFNYREKLLIKITQIYQKHFKEITEDEARDNGYSTAEALKNWVLDNLHCGHGTSVTIIKFELAQ